MTMLPGLVLNQLRLPAVLAQWIAGSSNTEGEFDDYGRY